MDKPNEIQALQFELMRRASFNNFDGERIVKELLAHPDLWEGVIMDRADYFYSSALGETDAKRRRERLAKHQEPVDLIRLRDIGEGYWNVDTVYLLPAEGKRRELEELVAGWGADEVGWMQNSHVPEYLRVWFD